MYLLNYINFIKNLYKKKINYYIKKKKIYL